MAEHTTKKRADSSGANGSGGTAVAVPSRRSGRSGRQIAADDRNTFQSLVLKALIRAGMPDIHESVLDAGFGPGTPLGRAFCKSLGEMIGERLIGGEDVYIYGIGRLVSRVKQKSTYKHPVTGHLRKVPERRAVSLRLTRSFRNELYRVKV